ncbi:MAG: hypothetical protein IKK03_01960 [Lachnospiraceae bacterium]|nr:hypothetical protein [Lachnospiraceae bacterium]
MIGQEISALKITWPEVGAAIKGELKKILGKDIECVATRETYDYWLIHFTDYEMPISELEFLLDILDINDEMRDDTCPYPEDNETVVKSIGMLMPRALLERALQCTWVAELPDTDVLWLMEINEQKSM